MSKVRRDKAKFKVNGVYFFIKGDNWGNMWRYNKFEAFRIVDDVICHKSPYETMWEPMSKEVQEAYQNYRVESILLGK